ncbi:OmpA family protein [Vibrio mediterranei]|nr:OmpA family protein [Vibrio mediterranei]
MTKIILLTSLLSILAFAGEYPQIFIGTRGGYQWALDDGYKHLSPEGAILGVYSGLQLTPSWEWDVGYQYHDELKADTTSINVKTWLIESALRYNWYLQDNLSLYGRLGTAYWRMGKAQSSSNESNVTGFSPLGEVGINYHSNPNIRWSAGYQYINSIGKSNTGEYDSHGLLISLAYTFGGVNPSTSVQPTSIPIPESTPVKEAVNVRSSSQIQTFMPRAVVGLFAFDAIEPSQDFTKQLTDVVAILSTYPQAQAIVVGHADSIGSDAYNQKLSERRAQTVFDKLIQLGVTPTQLEWRGEGSSRPVADSKISTERAKNRRVEVTIPCFQFQPQS